MRPTVSALRRWRIDDLAIASRVAIQRAAALAEQSSHIDRGIVAVHTWSGAGRSAAKRKISADADHAAEVRAVLQSLASTSATAGRELTAARDTVLREIDLAVDEGFAVSDTGLVRAANDSDISGSDAATVDPAAVDPATDAQRQIRENRIQLALSSFDAIDERHGRSLRTHATDLASMINGQRPITLPDGTKADPDAVVTRLRGMTPSARRTFLARLDADAVHQLVIADPEAMGNLDGVPLATRISANDINIRNALATEIAADRGSGSRARKLTEMLTPVDGSSRTFVSFSNTKVGQSIELIGTIDSSTRNVAVYVPGTNTNLNGSRSNYESARNLHRRSGASVFLHLDDRLPQKMGHENWRRNLAVAAVSPASAVGLEATDLHGSAADAGPAKAMGADLVAFGRELDTEIAAVAPGASTTYLGHSYGGVVVGTAEQLGLRADRVVYASSAGSGALDMPWHNANPNVARYSITAPGDYIHVVQSVERFGPDPDTLPDVTRLDTGVYGPSKGGGLVAGASAHGGYWDDPDSTAFANLVAVVAGEEPTPFVARVDDTPEPIRRVGQASESFLRGFLGLGIGR